MARGALLAIWYNMYDVAFSSLPSVLIPLDDGPLQEKPLSPHESSTLFGLHNRSENEKQGQCADRTQGRDLQEQEEHKDNLECSTQKLTVTIRKD